MNTKSLIAGSVTGLVVGLMLSPILFHGSLSRSTDTHTQIEDIDRHFIQQMIPHHQGAITMAQLALEKSTYPQVKSLAQSIIDTQQQEITQMEGWQRSWFGMDDHSTMHGHSHMDSMSGDMERLRTAQDFDLEFIRQMIPHHEMAVMMADMLQHSTSRPEMKELAENIVNPQSKEIEMMREWAANLERQ